MLKNISAKANALDDEDLESYSIAAHGIKNVLANIDETHLSGIALKLEQAAQDRNLDVILYETLAFIEALQKLVDKFKSRETEDAHLQPDNAEMSHDDKIILREKLHDVKTACEVFNIKAAETTLSALKQKTWPREIHSILDEISVILLRGEFGKLKSTLEKIAGI